MEQIKCNVCGSAHLKRLGGSYKCLSCDHLFKADPTDEEHTLLTVASDSLLRQEFGTAEEQFDNIIRRYPNNHRAYWGFVCARYGIRYEEDYDGKRIPTCCMPTIESFLDDASFLKAVELAPDDETKKWYRSQADYIERVRKTWIEKARNEAPYDLFLCYKNTADLTGVMDLYIHLSETYRVFFSRESLRDKIGEKYEPYVFNALQTAKVMIVYGSSAEDVTATWPKNEWQRFSKLIRNGEKAENALIVVCDGFNPGELPSMLSSRQCLDATKKTFYPDLDKALSALFRPTAVPVPKIAAVQSRSKKEVSKDYVHTYSKREIPSTCVEKGYTLHTCACGDEFKDQFKEYAPHDYKLTKTIEPFCTDKGYKRYNCSVCGHEKIEELPAPGHSFTAWTTSKRATCTEEGEEIRTCTACGEKETRPLAPLKHDFAGWAVSNTDPNKDERFCRRCGLTETRIGKKAKQLYDKGKSDLQSKKYDTARENLRLAAEKGLPEAQNEYALLLRDNPDGKGQDIQAAIVWFQKAIQQGYTPAMVNLGRLYETVENNREKALVLYQQAADKGNQEGKKEFVRIKKEINTSRIILYDLVFSVLSVLLCVVLCECAKILTEDSFAVSLLMIGIVLSMILLIVIYCICYHLAEKRALDVIEFCARTLGLGIVLVFCIWIIGIFTLF